ncbi:hypothetical protein BKA82DRAFT_872933 [Pisolithus tinctorius]|uniref:Uncharacterized protein n=1 Tax=Pisolithus tinctorius Marx 270 TaxID=870435 RepID=A0A0C3PAP6_PISTI|nr:hypothetical protein BKA82DRAFT_872933 [Pisolithus tinctorius]KIO10720.1 hypothetical protein M404DRAFT_872933 [Pisolithus tinctorius Marx 270]
MGRPLFSKTLRSTPVVREPEDGSCPYEKWSYVNAFDPDSDEFHETAVYEDFVGPAESAHLEEDVEEEDRDALVVRLGSFDSTSTASLSSLSDRASPLTAGNGDPANLADDFQDLREMENTETALTTSGSRIHLDELRWDPVPSAGDGRLHTASIPSPRTATSSLLTGAPVHRRDHSDRAGRRDTVSIPPRSAPIPVPVLRSRRTVAIDDRTPVTPPRQTPVALSPPPTVTPRLYSWGRAPVSPSSGSPFTNPAARTSYTHLSPAIIRLRDVVF